MPGTDRVATPVTFGGASGVAESSFEGSLVPIALTVWTWTVYSVPLGKLISKVPPLLEIALPTDPQVE